MNLFFGNFRVKEKISNFLFTTNDLRRGFLKNDDILSSLELTLQSSVILRGGAIAKRVIFKNHRIV